MLGLHLVWLATTLATLVSILFAGGGQLFPAAVGVMLIAGFKARLVLLHFMEVKRAPMLWRCLLEGWIVLCVAIILVIHLIGG